MRQAFKLEKINKQSKLNKGRRIISSVFYSLLIFVFISCSKNKQENKNEIIVKKDTLAIAKSTFIENLPKSDKPKVYFIDKLPKAKIIILPESAGSSSLNKSSKELEKTALVPAKKFELPVLKNKEGEIIKDSDGNTFILGLGGKTPFTNYNTETGLADHIYSSLVDRTGKIWLGTPGSGVYCYDGKSFTNYRSEQGLALDNINVIIEDKLGNIWFGTNAGVSCFNGTTFSNYTTEHGLANNTIKSILEDSKGIFWFGTDLGLSRFDRNKYESNKNNLKTTYQSQNTFKKKNNNLANCFQNFTQEHGLGNNSIKCIIEDKMGTIWIGTHGGGFSYCSASFDGKHEKKPFTTITTEQGLVNNFVNSSTIDKHGKIWLGTLNGASCFSPPIKGIVNEACFTNYTSSQGLVDNNVFTIKEDKKGNIWLGTAGGVSCFNNNNDANIETASGVTQQTQQEIKKNNLKPIKYFINFTSLQGLSNNNVKSIAEDKTGNLWFGTFGGGVSRYDGNAFTHFGTEQGLESNIIWSITEDKLENLWFVNYNSGISCYDGKSITNYNKNKGLAKYITCITEDKSGNLWIGTKTDGVIRFDGNRIDLIEKGDKNAMLMQEDLNKINGKLVKSFTYYTTEQGLADNFVNAITEDKLGNLWFGTSGGGVSCYSGSKTEAKGRVEKKPEENKNSNNNINAKAIKTFTNFTISQGLAKGSIACIQEDTKGNIWFGTYDSGISRFTPSPSGNIEKGYFTNFSKVNGLGSNIIFSIKEDNKGNVWFGTYGSGISRFDGKSFLNFTSEHGLTDKNITQILISKEQNLAIGGDRGLSVLTGFSSKVKNKTGPGFIPFQNNLSNEELKNYLPVIENYNYLKGYPIAGVNAGQNCMLQDSKGIIWIGTESDKTGLVRFDYEALNGKRQLPNVIIKSIKINNSTISWQNLISDNKTQNKNEEEVKTAESSKITEEITIFGKKFSDLERSEMVKKYGDIKFDSIAKFYPVPINLVLPYQHNNLSFDFIAIDPAKSYQIRYQYFLKGYNKDWSPLSNTTTANFGNINEGEYTLLIKAQNQFDDCSEPIEYKFTVLPPWYRTWWMYATYLIGLIIFAMLVLWGNGKRLIAKSISLTKEINNATKIIQEEKTKVELANLEIFEQKKQLEEKHKDITDSINYAQLIQKSILPNRKDIWDALPESFILYKPKDIVSGDFYFFNNEDSVSKVTNKKATFIAVADCTGHGVPGAFMSIIGATKLSEAIIQSTEPSEILSIVNRGIKTSLKQTDSAESTKDGMDIALCKLDMENNVVIFAGANRPFWLIRAGQTTIEEIGATRKAIGGYTDSNQEFDSHEIKLNKGDTFYIFTDGYVDQFGGEKGKKLMQKSFKNMLLEIKNKTMFEQKDYLNNFIENWKAGLEQVDDILVIGIRF